MDKRQIINDKLNMFLDETMELNDLPGLAVGVSIGDFEHVGVRGYRDYIAKTPLQADDIFHCASVSKLFTSSAVMRLVEAGAFGLYDRLCNILPSLEIKDERFREIRLWNMLTHTSGLGDVYDYHWDTYETDEDALRQYIYGENGIIENDISTTSARCEAALSSATEVIEQPMLWNPQCSPEFYGIPETDESGNPLLDENNQPKKLFRYSNIAYEILGQIVAEYSDRMSRSVSDETSDTHKLSYEDFVAEYLLKPAGMASSTMKTFDRCDFNSPEERELHDMASPHTKDDNRQVVSVEFYPYTRYHAPSSTLTSNVGDLLKWGRAHINTDVILQKETYDSIWRDYATVPNNGEKMGLGWFMRKQNVKSINGDAHEYTLYGHEGTDDGFRASFWICPELEMVTVVLSNLSGAPVKKINKKLFEILVK